MSRFRFRAWNKENEKWCFFDIPNALFTTTFFCDLEVITTDGKEFKHWCLSTGLKDKYGKEIFEGDIIKLKGQKRLIVFDLGIFWARSTPMGGQLELYLLLDVDPDQCAEIIGNKYEHKHLLGEENG